MSLRAAFCLVAACAAGAASPLAAAEATDSRSAGLRPAAPADPPPAAQAPAPLAVPDDHPRRYSLHRDYGEQPDATVLPPEFFLQSPPVAAEPDADAPRRDRQGRPIPAPAPDSPSL